MKKALRIAANVAAWLIVIFALLVTILVFSSTNNNGVPQLFGYIPLTVESQSMSPTFNQGDLIISKQIDDASALQVGDVISYWTIIDGQKVKNTHRIVRIETENGVTSFITRGDNNPIDDEVPTYPADLIGKLFELYKFIVTVVKVKKGNAEPALDEEEIKRRAIEEYIAAKKEKEAAAQSSSTESNSEESTEEKETPSAEAESPSASPVSGETVSEEQSPTE